MKKAKKVIHRSILPSKVPMAATVTYITALDYWNAPQWMWFIMVIFLVASWANAIIHMNDDEGVNIFEDKPNIKQHGLHRTDV